MTHLFSVLLNLNGRLCVVVGGGDVAARKATALLECDARLRVISPDFAPAFESWSAAGQVELVRRPYQSGDLDGAFLAIAATDDQAVNEAVWRDASATGVLVNVVDDPAHCTFTLPSTVRHGPFLLTASTGGASPALSRYVRERLERQYGPEYGVFASWLGELRGRVRSLYPRRRDRERVWRQLVTSDALDYLRQGDVAGARARVEDILARGPGGAVD